MQWSAAPGATQYLLYRGTAGQLPALLNATTDSCTRMHNAGQQSGQVLQESPPARSLFWYLVTASNSCGEGSPGSASAGPRIRNSTTSCTATCFDSVRNALETDVDCGGPDCVPCTSGQMCAGGSDCENGICNGRCPPPRCMDGVRNGTETDIDCGGGGCPLCANGKLCNVPGDCASSNCPGINCQPYTPTCTDGIRNGSESDVDCGGTCTDCASGRRCNVGSDCQSGVCVSGICQ